MVLKDIVSNPNDVKWFNSERTTNAFSFVFEKDLEMGETIMVKMPAVSANKRGVNDIGWMSNCDVDIDDEGNEIPKLKLYGTLSENPKSEKALWQEIRVNDEVNKVVSALLVVNNGGACRFEMRAILC